MSVWLREIAGWALLGLGVFVFLLSYNLLVGKRLLEAIPAVFIGVIVFRGGLHLLKVAVAARACREVAAPPAARPARRPIGPTRPLAQTRPSAIPGPGGGNGK
jgi:hypothetical protein